MLKIEFIKSDRPVDCISLRNDKALPKVLPMALSMAVGIVSEVRVVTSCNSLIHEFHCVDRQWKDRLATK